MHENWRVTFANINNNDDADDEEEKVVIVQVQGNVPSTPINLSKQQHTNKIKINDSVS